MRRHLRCSFFFISSIFFLVSLAPAQMFPIAVGSDNVYGGGGAFDGTNFLITIQGDQSGPNSMTAQLMSLNGSLSGPRISLGKTGSSPLAAFDGTRFLVVWTDIFPVFAGGDTNGIGNIYGQFVSTAGTLSGSSFTIASNVNIKFGKGRGSIVCHDTTYMVTFLKGTDHHTDYLYAQRIGKSGTLIGTPVQVSSHYAREHSVAFDGTNYLIAWCKVDHPLTDNDIYGQLISPSGILVGQNFLIDGSEVASDNPVTTAFDGTRYLILFHDQAATDERWNLIGRFVSTAGTPAERFTVCDSSKNPNYAAAAFDGRNYLVTWMEYSGKLRVKGRFFNPMGTAFQSPFMVFDTIGTRYPIGGVGGFLNGKFLLSCTMIDTNFSDIDLYGMFLDPSPTAVKGVDGGNTGRTYALHQNYPNPFNPSTAITYELAAKSAVHLAVYDLLGREIATLVDEIQESGFHRVPFHPHGLASGVYLYVLRTGTFTDMKKLLLVR